LWLLVFGRVENLLEVAWRNLGFRGKYMVPNSPAAKMKMEDENHSMTDVGFCTAGQSSNSTMVLLASFERSALHGRRRRRYCCAAQLQVFGVVAFRRVSCWARPGF
jgi:hypothetical protein